MKYIYCFFFVAALSIGGYSQIENFKALGYNYLPVSGLGNHVATSADIDGDGDMDLFIGRAFQTDLVFLNDGTGKFSLQPNELWTLRGATYDALFTDLNNDNKPDLILSRGPENGGTVGGLPAREQILINLGNGKFEEHSQNLQVTQYDTINFSMALAMGDLNNDNQPDLVFANGCINYLPRTQIIKNFSLLIKNQLLQNDVFFAGADTDNDGIANFSRQNPASIGISVSDVSTDVVIADFDKDGFNDIFITNFYDRDINNFPIIGLGLGDDAYFNKLYLNNPAQPGTFTWAKNKFPQIKYPSTSVAADDVDRDGYLDLVITNDANAGGAGNTEIPRIYINDKTGGFTDQTLQYIPELATPPQFYSGYDVQFVDINNDNLNDIFIGGQTNMLLVKQPNNTFKIESAKLPQQLSANEPFNFSTYSVAIADFDNNNRKDLVLANSYEQIRLQTQVAGLSFKDVTASENLFTNGENNFDAVITDLQGNGRNDIVNGIYNERATHAIYINDKIVNGKAAFSNTLFLPVPQNFKNVRGIDASDLNNDGTKEILLSGYDGCKLFYTTSSLAFSDSTSLWFNGFEGYKNANEARFVDINNDGIEDIFIPNGKVGNGAQNNLLVWNKNTGKYEDVTATWLPNDNAISLKADFRDINDDGWKDILVANSNQSIMLYLSQTAFPSTNPNYTVVSSFGDNASSTAKFGDFNNDGLVDIAEASEDGSKLIRVFLNSGTTTSPVYNSPISISSSGGAIGDIEVFDINNDDKDDIVTADFNTSDVYISDITGTNGNFNNESAKYFPEAFAKESWFAISLTVGDINNDGVMDLYFSRDNQDLLLYGSKVGQGVGIEKFTQNNNLNLYPNPANTSFTIANAEVQKVVVYTLTGKKVIECAGCHTIDISGLSSGMYIVKAQTEKSILTQKLIKE